MKDWTLAELIADVKFRVAFNEGQTDMEYRGPAGDVDRHFRDAINEAYADEYNEAAIAGVELDKMSDDDLRQRVGDVAALG